VAGPASRMAVLARRRRSLVPGRAVWSGQAVCGPRAIPGPCALPRPAGWPAGSTGWSGFPAGRRRWRQAPGRAPRQRSTSLTLTSRVARASANSGCLSTAL